MARKDFKIVVDIHAESEVDGEFVLVDSTDTAKEARERMEIFFTQLFCTLDAGFDMDVCVTIKIEK